MMRIKLYLPLLFLVCLIFPKLVQASHCAGGELTYTWVSDSTYKFTFKMYRDCSSTLALGTTFPLCYRSSCNPTVAQITMNLVSGPTPVIVPCVGTQTTCENRTMVGNPNYQEHVYEGTVFNLPKCADWVFSTYLNARNASVNIQAASSTDFYVETTLNNLIAQGNSSPQFTVRPVPFTCINLPYTFNNGASDPNNDSLSFELVMPKGHSGACANGPTTLTFAAATPPFNLTTNPLACNNTFVMNQTTGQFSFTPNATGAYTMSLLVKEWRGGVLIGSVIRDIQVQVRSSGCSQQPAVVPQPPSSIGVDFPATAGNPIQACARQAFTLCTRITSPDTAAWLAVNSNFQAIAATSTMSYTGIGTDTVMACWTWIPSASDTGLRILTYTVRDTNCLTNGGYATSQTFSVPVFINPVTMAVNDTTICFGDAANLNVTGGSNFVWTVLPGGDGIGSLSCTNCNNPIATPSMTTRYVVTSSGTSFCNNNKDTVTVTIAPIPTFNAGPDTTTCINNSLQLNANVALPPGTYSIQWTPSTYLNNANIPDPIITPTNDISYVIRVVPGTAGACALYDTLRVNVVQGYNLLNVDTAICDGLSVDVNISGDNRYKYTWTPIQGVTDPNIMAPTITPDTSKLYTVTATFPGCRDSVRSFYIDVHPNPTVFIGIDKVLCYGDTVHIDEARVTPDTYPNYIYSWTPAGSFENPNVLKAVYQGFTTATLRLQVTTPAPASCRGEASVTYTVIPSTFIQVSADTAICPGDTAQLHVTGDYASLRWIPTTYINDTVSADPKVWPVTTTVYSVIGKDVNSCLDTQDVQVRINPRGLLSLPDSVTIFPGESYAINPGGNCLYFTWFPLSGLTNANIANPVASPEVNTRYFVRGVTEAGCVVTDSMDVNVSPDSWIDIPNAFSPGSQPNALFKIVRRGNATVKQFKVFNRWGAEVFSTNNVDEGWNGTWNGNPQPMGVYVFIVEAISPTGRRFYKQGNVTLIR
jgi:gliding motility-associated-like protein